MRTLGSFLLVVAFPVVLLAQTPVVVSTSPADNAVNVSASTTTFSITFDAAVDTASFKATSDGPSGGIMSSLDSVAGCTFSPDHKTVNIGGKISAGKPYFILLFYAKRTGGSVLSVPFVFRFTTAGSFPSTTVSGTVTTGTSGVSPAYAIVGLNGGPINEKAAFRAGTVADASGAFVVPYVPDGTLYPVAAKSISVPGIIDPSQGDPVATGAPITVSGSNITGMVLALQGPLRPRFRVAVDSLNAHLASLPSPSVLRRVQGSGMDSTGAGSRWQFDFTGSSRQTSFTFEVEQMGCRVDSMDQNMYSWITSMTPLGAPPSYAAVDSFLARAERGGGGAYRPRPMSWNGFDAELIMGDLYYSEFYKLVGDTSRMYMGMKYEYYAEPSPGQWTMLKQRLILGDYSTGEVLGTTGVVDHAEGGIPAQFDLKQNYPNPFNPSTTIAYSVAGFRGQASGNSWVKLAIYDLLGREVAVLVEGAMEPGEHSVTFDGGRVSSGVYLYRMSAGGFTQSRRMLLMR